MEWRPEGGEQQAIQGEAAWERTWGVPTGHEEHSTMEQGEMGMGHVYGTGAQYDRAGEGGRQSGPVSHSLEPASWREP